MIEFPAGEPVQGPGVADRRIGERERDGADLVQSCYLPGVSATSAADPPPAYEA